MNLPSWLIVISLSFCLSLFWVFVRAPRWSYHTQHALNLSIWMMLGALVGGRSFHIFYEHPQYYLHNPLAVVKIWEGGFVFYGALFGALLFGFYKCKQNKFNYKRWADFFTPIFSFNYALGRLACFFNGCCYGRPCHLPWAISFPVHALWGIPVEPRHPTQLYAAIWEALLLISLLSFEKWLRSYSGRIFTFWLGFHALGRLLMEHWRDDDRGPVPLGFSIGTWISGTLILISLFLFFRQTNAERLETVSQELESKKI